MSVDINKLPKVISSAKSTIRFRNKSNSNELNNLNNNLIFDLNNIMNIVNEIDNDINEINRNTAIDNIYTQIRINNLEAQINNNNKNTIKIFPCNCISDGADVDAVHNQVSIKKNKTISKLYIYDEAINQIFIPDSLKIDVTPKADNKVIIENNFKNALDNKKSYWVRKVVNNDATSVDVTIEITLPDNIISNKDINVIKFNPFPYGTLDIISLQYQCNGNWSDIPGVKSYKNSSADTLISNSENMKICFNKIQATKIRLTLRQNTYIEENNNKVFYIGLKSFDVLNEITNDFKSYFSSVIRFKDNNKKIINGIKPVFNNENILSNPNELLEFELYSIDNNNKDYIKNSLPIQVNKQEYVIVFKLNADLKNNINPTLREIDIDYIYIQ